jgi:protein-S-isoprenylcysteine O-methyltransferase Ste14
MEGPDIKVNPLKLVVTLLVISYVVGEFIIPKYSLAYFIQLIGVLGLILSGVLFITGFNQFKSHGEDPLPSSSTNKLIKTGIFARTRNPIYLAFVLFHLSMFLVFENVMNFLSAIGLSIWLHHWVIKIEESFLQSKFGEEYDQYKKSVKRWLFI